MKKIVYLIIFLAGFVLASPLVAKSQSRFGELLIEPEKQISNFRRLLDDEIVTPKPIPVDEKLKAENIIEPEKELTIAVLGDSMIDVLQSDLPQLQSVLENYFPKTKFKLFNFGVGASDLEYAVERLTNDYEYLGSKYPAVLSVEPDILVLESFAYNNFGYGKEGLDKQWLLIGDIITKTELLSPDTEIVLAATIAPNSTVYGRGIDGINWNQAERLVRSETVKEYLQNMVNFADSQNFPLANAYHSSQDRYGEGKPIYINGNDNLHPSGPGGELFCLKVADAIASLDLSEL